MRRFAIALAFGLFLASGLATGHAEDKDRAYLDGVTERGRALYAYDQAAWKGTDAFFALHPDTNGLTHYICHQSPSGWIVTFGRWNSTHDKLLIVYEDIESGKTGEYKAQAFDPPREASDGLTAKERALELAIGNFKGENRPYNTAILPAPNGNLYVYIYPGQTKDTVWPLGGDVRFTISADGKQIVEKRELHKTILDLEFKPDDHPVAGVHSHVLSDLPEDTDVLYVLNRRPSIPEHIGTPKQSYVVNTDGTIVIEKK